MTALTAASGPGAERFDGLVVALNPEPEGVWSWGCRGACLLEWPRSDLEPFSGDRLALVVRSGCGKSNGFWGPVRCCSCSRPELLQRWPACCAGQDPRLLKPPRALRRCGAGGGTGVPGPDAAAFNPLLRGGGTPHNWTPWRPRRAGRPAVRRAPSTCLEAGGDRRRALSTTATPMNSAGAWRQRLSIALAIGTGNHPLVIGSMNPPPAWNVAVAAQVMAELTEPSARKRQTRPCC